MLLCCLQDFGRWGNPKTGCSGEHGKKNYSKISQDKLCCELQHIFLYVVTVIR